MKKLKHLYNWILTAIDWFPMYVEWQEAGAHPFKKELKVVERTKDGDFELHGFRVESHRMDENGKIVMKISRNIMEMDPNTCISYRIYSNRNPYFI